MNNAKLLRSLPFHEVKENLKSSRYFLHTNINEPFGITAVEAILSGCLPLVHDSGGQREVVPIDELRFSSLAEVPEKLSVLESSPDSRGHWLKELQQLALSSYVRSVFVAQFKEYLTKAINEVATRQ